MSEKNDSIFESEDFLILLRKYEQMKADNSSGFFDVEEFEQIIDYYLDEFKYDQAEEAASLAATQHPASVEIKYKTVHVYLEQGITKVALELLEQVPVWEHSNAEFYYLKGTALCLSGKIHEAEKNFDKGLRLTEEDPMEALLNIAIAFENARQFELAIKYLEQAKKIQPSNLSVLYDLGYFYERIDKFNASVEYYSNYLDIDPFSENVWYNLGVAYFKLDKPTKAIEAYDYAIALNVEYAAAYFNKANTFGSLEDYDSAIGTIEEFLELEPDNTQALCFLGDCFEQKRFYIKALEAYKKAINIDNTESEGWFGAGMVLYQQNKYEEAISYLVKALEFDRDNTDYWMNLGYVYEENKQYSKAVKCFQKVTVLDNTDYEAWHSLAAVLLRNTKEPEKAISVLEKALRFFPEDKRLLVKMAAAQFMINNSTEGVDNLEKALSRDNALISEFALLYMESNWTRPIRRIIKRYKP